MSAAGSVGIGPRPGVTPSSILRWVVAGILTVLGLMSYVVAAGRYTSYSPEVYSNYWPERGWLILHILGGTVALFTGPVQFLTGLRRRKMRLHRAANIESAQTRQSDVEDDHVRAHLPRRLERSLPILSLDDA